AIKGFTELGLHTNEITEQAEQGIAAIITTQATLTDASGRALTGMEALEGATRISTEQIEKLKVESFATKASFEEIFKGFGTAIPPRPSRRCGSMGRSSRRSWRRWPRWRRRRRHTLPPGIS